MIEILDGICTGIFLAVLLYSIVYYIATPSKVALWYIAMLSSTYLLVSTDYSYIKQLTLLKAADYYLAIITLPYFLTCLSSVQLSRYFLGLNNYPKLNTVALSAIVLFTSLALFTWFSDSAMFYFCCALFAIFSAIYALACSIYMLKKRRIRAKYYLLANIPFAIALSEFILNQKELPNGHLVTLRPDIMVSLAMVLLVFGVGRINQRETQQALTMALEDAELNNEQTSNYNQQLKNEIAQNTLQFRVMNSNIEQQTQKLQKANQQKSQLISRINSEISKPLAHVQASLTAMLQKPGFQEKATLANAVYDCHLLLHRIDQLIMLDQLDNNTMSLQASNYNLSNVLQQLVAQFDSIARQRNVLLDYEYQQELIEAYIDYDKLQMIVNCLLDNALQCTAPEGLILVKIDIVEKTDQDNGFATKQYARIVITDTGRGIAEQDQPFIFKRDFHASTPTQTDDQDPTSSAGYTGSSVGSVQVAGTTGLPLVKVLVELHSGQIHFNSSEQQGSEFTILLPLGCAHLNPAQNSVMQQANSTPCKTTIVTGKQDTMKPVMEETPDRHIESNPPLGNKLASAHPETTIIANHKNSVSDGGRPSA